MPFKLYWVVAMLFKPQQMQHWVDIVEPQAAAPSLLWYLTYLLLALVLLFIVIIVARRSPAVWLLYARYKLRKLQSDRELQQFVVWLERKLRKQTIAHELQQQLLQWRYANTMLNKNSLGSFLQRCLKERIR
jgi:hypothetical protein